MNKKGQALVEFIIIMPIFIMILLASFDLVKIFSTKIELENKIEEVISLEKADNLIFTKEVNDEFITYKLSKDIEITSPLVSLVTDNKYRVTIERTIYNE